MVKEYTPSITISSSYGSASTDVSVDGYTPIGVVGFYNNNSYYAFYRCRINGSTLNVGVRRLYDNTETTTLTVNIYVLYEISNFVSIATAQEATTQSIGKQENPDNPAIDDPEGSPTPED